MLWEETPSLLPYINQKLMLGCSIVHHYFPLLLWSLDIVQVGIWFLHALWGPELKIRDLILAVSSWITISINI